MSGGRPIKRSLTLRGHRTSVSLEAEFWQAFREIAAAEGKAINALAAEIDAARGTDPGLATAIRLHVLRWYRSSSRPAGAPAEAPDAVQATVPEGRDGEQDD